LGHEVTVLTCAYKDNPSFEIIDGVKVYRVAARYLPESKLSLNFDIAFGTRVRNFFILWRLIKEISPDVVHFHGQFFDLTWIVGVFAKIQKVPSVLTLHTRLEHPNRVFNFLFMLLDLFLVHPMLTLIRPDKIIAIDSRFMRYSKRRYFLVRNRLKYIPIGVDLEPYDAMTRDVNTFASHNIISLGHIIPVRDRITLIRSLPLVIKFFPDVKVHIFGKVYYAEFQRIAEDLNVSSSIIVHGQIPMEEVPSRMAQSSLEITHIQGFGFGISTLEAMASGLPVVMNAPKDYFPHAPLVDGFNYFENRLGDSEHLASIIIRSFNHPRESYELGQEARRFVYEHFDMRKITQDYLNLFVEIL
jgi:glycosyltransferase involved in cell wall biosynthesis